MKPIIPTVLFCISIVTSINAGIVAVDTSTGEAGLGGGITSGFEFAVTNAEGILVDGLGYWDDGSDGFFLGQTFPVGLWEANTGKLLRTTVITSSSALTSSVHPEGDWRVNGVTPVYLAPGLYRLGGLEPTVGANATISGGATLQLASGINIVRYLRHIDGSTLVMPDISPPASGYMFHCATFTVVPGAVGTNGATFFHFSSSPTAWIGAGQTQTFTNLSVSRTFDLGAYTDSVHFSSTGYGLTIVGPNLTLARVGYYPGATRWPFMGTGPGMDMTAPGRGNNALSGWFNVLQADYQTNGQVAAFAVDFVQYDEGNVTRWNRGNIRYKSNIPVPGLTPPMQITTPVKSNDVVRFTLTGPAETQCVVQTSSNLTTWTPLLNSTISPVGLVAISDTNGAGQRTRFYRAIVASGGGSTNNDNFADRIQIPSAGATVTGTNSNASKETGEPNHGNYPGGRSLWWTWTSTSSGLVTISLDGSSFDTTLGVYQGTAVNSLTSIAQDDEGGVGHTSRVIFNATAGSTYQIAVDGYVGATGGVTLTVKPGLLNDDFANRLQLHSLSDWVVGSNVGADWEQGEPYHWQTTGQQSVWWKWQALFSGTVIITTAGSSFDTLLAAYTGSSVGGLSLVANNDDYGDITSRISFNAVAGTTYQIAVDGYGLASGSIQLTLQQQ